MASARSIAAQRAIRGPLSISVPKGSTSPLPKVAPITKGVRNDHLANPGGGRKDLSRGRKG